MGGAGGEVHSEKMRCPSPPDPPAAERYEPECCVTRGLNVVRNLILRGEGSEPRQRSLQPPHCNAVVREGSCERRLPTLRTRCHRKAIETWRGGGGSTQGGPGCVLAVRLSSGRYYFLHGYLVSNTKIISIGTEYCYWIVQRSAHRVTLSLRESLPSV